LVPWLKGCEEPHQSEFQQAPIVSFTVKPDSLFQGDDVRVPLEKVLPVTLAERSKRALVWTIFQGVLFQSIKLSCAALYRVLY
jgi:hypothetical protein